MNAFSEVISSSSSREQWTTQSTSPTALDSLLCLQEASLTGFLLLEGKEALTYYS
jgi:hypothetical protein